MNHIENNKREKEIEYKEHEKETKDF